MSGLVAAGLTVLVALFLTPIFRNLPEATLAAIVIVAVYGMFKWREMLRLARLRRTDFVLALVTFLGVLTFEEALWALLLAVVLSLLALVWRTSQGHMSELGLARGRLIFEPLRPDADVEPIDRLLIFAPEESLFFANADTVRTQITNRLAAGSEPVDGVLLDLELTNVLDVPSAEMLKELHDDLDAAGVQLLLARVRPAVRDLLERSGVVAVIGPDHIYKRVLMGVLAAPDPYRQPRQYAAGPLRRDPANAAAGCHRNAPAGRRAAPGAVGSAERRARRGDRPGRRGAG